MWVPRPGMVPGVMPYPIAYQQVRLDQHGRMGIAFLTPTGVVCVCQQQSYVSANSRATLQPLAGCRLRPAPHSSAGLCLITLWVLRPDMGM
jgi:hypothetical protein